VDLHQLQSLDDNEHKLQICCIQRQVNQEMEDSPTGLTSIEDICANDIPQAFYDSQCMILALNAEQEKEADLRSQYIGIPWTEGPKEQTVLVADLNQ
jgi:hypothetical protein